MHTSNLAVRVPCQLWQTFIIVLHQRQDVAFLWQHWMRTRCRHQCVLFECLLKSLWEKPDLNSVPANHPAFSFFSPLFLIMFCLLPLKQPDSPFSFYSSTDPLWPGCNMCPCILLLCLSSQHLPVFPSESACFVWRGKRKHVMLKTPPTSNPDGSQSFHIDQRDVTHAKI